MALGAWALCIQVWRTPAYRASTRRCSGRSKKIALIVVAAVLVVALCFGGVAFAAVGQAGELKAKASEAMADINAVMDGEIDEVIEKLQIEENTERLKASGL